MPSRVLAILLLGSVSGCATAFSLPAALVVDQDGNPGGEGAVRATALLEASDTTSLLTSFGIGGGSIRDSGYMLVAPALGVEAGRLIAARASLFSTIRFFDVGSGNARGSIGGELAVLFQLRPTGGEDAVLRFGPRLGVEALPADPRGRIVSLGVMLEWVAFDTRRESWAR